MIKVAIIDDEKHCILILEHLLKLHAPDVQIVFTTQESTEALTLIKSHSPQLVFLDIEMPRLNGFELLQQIENVDFKVVFTTAFNQYAIKALKMNALDYLLKPLSGTDISECLDRYRKEEMNTTREQLTHVHQFMNGKLQDTLALSTQEGLVFIRLEDIAYLEGEGCYTHLIMQDQSRHLASKTLSNFEEVVDDNPLFFRAHKSHIINLKFIKQYIRGEGGEIIMQDGKNIALSRNKKQEFLSMFKKV